MPVGTGTSDIDHVVIGPPGVFSINTKHHDGKDVRVGAKRILVSGQRTDYLRNSLFEAKRASQLLSVALKCIVDVTPVIVIVRARRVTVRERPATVVVLRERQLAGWLARRPAVFTPADVARIADAAALPSTWRHAPVLDAVDLSAFQALRADVARCRSRRRAWTLSLVLALLVAMPAAYVAVWNSLVAVIAG